MLCICSVIFLAHSVCAASIFDETPRTPVPIPPNERDLPTAESKKFAIAGDNGQSLEGAVFDRRSNLLFSDITGGRILRLTPTGKVETCLTLQNLHPCGLALHEDGRLFICAAEPDWKRGAILAVSPDGKHIETIVSASEGYLPNDLVFDRNGGIYFSDFRGTSTDPKGGVYYLSPDFSSVKPVIPNLAQVNGVALSPDGKTLWATEYAKNRLHRVALSSPTESPVNGTKVAYHFTGSGQIQCGLMPRAMFMWQWLVRGGFSFLMPMACLWDKSSCLKGTWGIICAPQVWLSIPAKKKFRLWPETRRRPHRGRRRYSSLLLSHMDSQQLIKNKLYSYFLKIHSKYCQNKHHIITLKNTVHLCVHY